MATPCPQHEQLQEEKPFHVDAAVSCGWLEGRQKMQGVDGVDGKVCARAVGFDPSVKSACLPIYFFYEKISIFITFL